MALLLLAQQDSLRENSLGITDFDHFKESFYMHLMIKINSLTHTSLWINAQLLPDNRQRL